ncbi:zinc ABC transporter substrate-binding protein [bacterium]|nr:zinc ABC transporter substrate-binding protein [bacterium]
MNWAILYRTVLIVSAWILGLWAGIVGAEPIEIWVSISPQQYLVERIGGELVRVHVLVSSNQDPHIFEPSPRQIQGLSRARLYYSIGLPFEQVIVQKILGQDRSLKHIALDRDLVKRVMVDDHAGHDQKADREKGGLAGEAFDPHVWLGSEHLKKMVQIIAQSLITLDPKHAAVFDSNRVKVLNDIDAVDLEIGRILEPVKGRSIYVFHPAFGYFTDRYGLKQVALEVDGKSPGPKHMTAMINRARSEGVRDIFIQSQHDQRSALAIARALGGEVIPLDPLAFDILTNMKTMAQAIKKALI